MRLGGPSVPPQWPYARLRGKIRVSEVPVLRKWIRDEEGATSIEYGLIGALIAVVIVLALTNVGTAVQAKFDLVANSVVAAGS